MTWNQGYKSHNSNNLPSEHLPSKIPIFTYKIHSTLKYLEEALYLDQLLQGLLQFSNASPIMSRAGRISLTSCVDIYTKLKLVHWTLDVHQSCSSLLNFTFKNNSLHIVQKKRKNIMYIAVNKVL